MKVAIVFLALLPIILSMTLEEHEAQWRQLSHEERLSGMYDGLNITTCSVIVYHQYYKQNQ